MHEMTLLLQLVYRHNFPCVGQMFPNTVSAIVVGFWAQDAHSTPGVSLRCSEVPIHKNFVVYRSTEQLWTTLIRAFTVEGELVVVFQEDNKEGT